MKNVICPYCAEVNKVDTQSTEWKSASGWIQCEQCALTFHESNPNTEKDYAAIHNAYNHGVCVVCAECL